jgi:hypothetical protein
MHLLPILCLLNKRRVDMNDRRTPPPPDAQDANPVPAAEIRAEHDGMIIVPASAIGENTTIITAPFRATIIAYPDGMSGDELTKFFAEVKHQQRRDAEYAKMLEAKYPSNDSRY